MRTGAILAVVVAVAAGIGLSSVFVNNASPYVTIKEAGGRADKVHIVGKLDQSTLKQNTLAREVTFLLRDETGEMPVRYTGPPQSNLASATQVVVIGKKMDGTFEATQMLVKCPSKYESEKGATPASSKDKASTKTPGD